MSCSGRMEQFLPGRPPFNTLENKIISCGKEVYLRGPVSQEQLAGQTLSEGLRCFRPSCKQLKALADLAGQPDGLIFTACRFDTIVAYAAFQKPDDPWWKNRRCPCLLELGGLETDPEWRGAGLASALLQAIFCKESFTYFEHFLIIAVQSPHNWDLAGSGLEPWTYGKFMIDFLKKFGFHRQETGDPEITQTPGSFLLVRTGRFVDERSKSLFLNHCLPH